MNEDEVFENTEEVVEETVTEETVVLEKLQMVNNYLAEDNLKALRQFFSTVEVEPTEEMYQILVVTDPYKHLLGASRVRLVQKLTPLYEKGKLTGLL